MVSLSKLAAEQSLLINKWEYQPRTSKQHLYKCYIGHLPFHSKPKRCVTLSALHFGASREQNDQDSFGHDIRDVLHREESRRLSTQLPVCMEEAPVSAYSSSDCIAPEMIFSSKPVVIFTAGIPGSGKTSVLRKVYSIEDNDILDLDAEILHHPLYNPEVPSEVYDLPDAYVWADNRLESKFKHRLQHAPKFSAIDGTGCKVDRTLRRMRAAKRAGCFVVLLFVNTSLETALRRNQGRQRQVPEKVMRQYSERIYLSVNELKSAADLFVTFNNNSEAEEFERMALPTTRTVSAQMWCHDLLGAVDLRDEYLSWCDTE